MSSVLIGVEAPKRGIGGGRFGRACRSGAHAESGGWGRRYKRRGAGTYVAHVPTDYLISKHVRFHQNLVAAGRIPAKEVLSLETRAADLQEREALQLLSGDVVHVYEGLSLADEQPIALFRSVFPRARFPMLCDDLAETKSVTAALKRSGVDDYMRVSTRLTAKLAMTTQALHLRLSEGAPILRAVAVNVDLGGQPIEFGQTWFAGDRVTLTVDGMGWAYFKNNHLFSMVCVEQ